MIVDEVLGDELVEFDMFMGVELCGVGFLVVGGGNDEWVGGNLMLWFLLILVVDIW